ncbi:MAG: NUDIX hydrolase [Armatimonadetes bacterium]|nr:NUDIX hydrolase [Armatimonadota bacterium]
MLMLQEETLSSEILYDGLIIRVRMDTVKTRSGRTTKREIVEHPGAAAVVALNDRNEVLLVRQYRKATEQTTIEIPAGKLDPGESPEICIRRELGEETGYAVSTLDKLAYFYLTPGISDEKTHLFLATLGERNPSLQIPDEIGDHFFVPLAEALEMVDEGQIPDAKTIAGLLMAQRRLRGRP